MLDEFKNDTIVVNCKTDNYDVYIGRPSEFGNPFTHIKDKKTSAKFITKTREEAISKYREWLNANPLLVSKLETLRGKKLGCWCKPKSCHGDILIEFLNNKHAI